jgi:hypothetical protein
MNTKQLLEALDAVPAERFKAWKDHCLQVVQGYDKIEPRLLQKINDDHAMLLKMVDMLNRRLIENSKTAGQIATNKCCAAVVDYHRQCGVDQEVTDKLLALLQPDDEQASVQLPDFSPRVAGGYGG